MLFFLLGQLWPGDAVVVVVKYVLRDHCIRVSLRPNHSPVFFEFGVLLRVVRAIAVATDVTLLAVTATVDFRSHTLGSL